MRAYYPPGYFRRRPPQPKNPIPRRIRLRTWLLHEVGIFEGFVLIEALTYAALAVFAVSYLLIGVL